MGMLDKKWVVDDGTTEITVDAYTPDEVKLPLASNRILMPFGLHLVVLTAASTFAAFDVRIMHGAATAPTTVLISRPLGAAAVLVKAAHFFIPMPPVCLQFLRAHYDITTTGSTYIYAYFGPGSEGAI